MPSFFEKYPRGVNCPSKIQDHQEAADCLLGFTVRLEYGDNAEHCKDLVPDHARNIDSATENAEPSISLDEITLVLRLMGWFWLTFFGSHGEDPVMLEAICVFVPELPGADAVAKANPTKEGFAWCLSQE